jgi:hypothetical protein
MLLSQSNELSSDPNNIYFAVSFTKLLNLIEPFPYSNVLEPYFEDMKYRILYKIIQRHPNTLVKRVFLGYQGFPIV